MSGLLFPPGDLAVLAANLAQLATNPNLCQRLGEAARQRVVNEFSLDRMLTSYEALYLNLAVRRSVSLGR
jgi:glycosyltransferase involved in cell wall biosynthesis